MKRCFWLGWPAANGSRETYKVLWMHDPNDLLDRNPDQRSTLTAAAVGLLSEDELVGCRVASTKEMCGATDWLTGIERCDAVG